MTPSPVRVIHNDAELAAALIEYEAYFDVEPRLGAPEGDRFELLGLVCNDNGIPDDLERRDVSIDPL